MKMTKRLEGAVKATKSDGDRVAAELRRKLGNRAVVAYGESQLGWFMLVGCLLQGRDIRPTCRHVMVGKSASAHKSSHLVWVMFLGSLRLGRDIRPTCSLR